MNTPPTLSTLPTDAAVRNHRCRSSAVRRRKRSKSARASSARSGRIGPKRWGLCAPSQRQRTAQVGRSHSGARSAAAASCSSRFNAGNGKNRPFGGVPPNATAQVRNRPTVTELADRGHKPKPVPLLDLEGVPPAGFHACNAEPGLEPQARECSRRELQVGRVQEGERGMKSEHVSSLFVLQMPSGEFLALSQEQFKDARALGRRITSPAPVVTNDGPDHMLLTAEQMEARTSIPATWFLEQPGRTRSRMCASAITVGFSFSEVCEACERVRMSQVEASVEKGQVNEQRIGDTLFISRESISYKCASAFCYQMCDRSQSG